MVLCNKMHNIDRPVVNLAMKVAPPTWNGTEAGVTATFEGMADHIRITGAVALTRPSPCPYPYVRTQSAVACDVSAFPDRILVVVGTLARRVTPPQVRRERESFLNQ